MIFCTKCGKQNIDTARFCTACGHVLAKADETVESKIVQSPIQVVGLPTPQKSAQEIESDRRNAAMQKKIGYTVLGLIVAGIFIYFLLIRTDPASDGKKAASLYCDCNENKNAHLKEMYKKFISDFDSYKFSGKKDARNKLISLIQSTRQTFTDCDAENTTMLEKSKAKYTGYNDKIEKFESAFINRLTLCAVDNKELISLDKEAFHKVDQFVGPREKEQAMRDSIKARDAVKSQLPFTENSDDINYAGDEEGPGPSIEVKKVSTKQTTAQLRLLSSLDYAEKNPPGIERMKQDIRGKTFILPVNELGWKGVHYSTDEIFLNLISSGNSFQKDDRLFSSSIEMTTTDSKNIRYNLTGSIFYTWDTNTSTWYFKTITVNKFQKLAEPQKNTVVDNAKTTDSKITIADILSGTWTGDVFQGKRSYPVLLTCKTSTNEFKISYTSLNCSGNWNMEKSGEQSMDFREHIITGKLSCVDGGLVRLTLISKNQVEFDFFQKNSNTPSSKGILTKK